MMWRDTEFEDLHRVALTIDPCESKLRATMPDTEATRDSLRVNARTWEQDGRIVAVVGIAPLWKGVGTVWTLLSDEARQRGVVLTRGVLRFLSMLHRERGYWRVQATVERGDETARHWILKLGFQYEGTMAAYSPDLKTHDMYARVRL